MVHQRLHVGNITHVCPTSRLIHGIGLCLLYICDQWGAKEDSRTCDSICAVVRGFWCIGWGIRVKLLDGAIFLGNSSIGVEKIRLSVSLPGKGGSPHVFVAKSTCYLSHPFLPHDIHLTVEFATYQWLSHLPVIDLTLDFKMNGPNTPCGHKYMEKSNLEKLTVYIQRCINQEWRLWCVKYKEQTK